MAQKSLRIAASLAAAPLDRLGETVLALENAGVDSIHFDIEDGSFVPMMTLGTKIIGDLRPYTRLPFEAHLMMVNPEWILEDVAGMGANRISVHYEACAYPRRILRKIVSLGAAAGIAINPATPLPDLEYLLPELSFVVVLTTEPESGECALIPEALGKVRAGKRMPRLAGLEWTVDGGVRAENIRAVAAAGADTVVIGRALLAGGQIGENVAAIRSAAAS
jgi:ribulose-phosphate 3-epimerase